MVREEFSANLRLALVEDVSLAKFSGPSEDLLVIPLNAMLTLDPAYSGYQLANISEWFGPDDHASMHNEVVSLWEEFTHVYSGQYPHYFSYEFHVLATQFVYCRRIIKEALSRYRPIGVVLAEASSISRSAFREPAELFGLLRYRLIREETGKLEQTYISGCSSSFPTESARLRNVMSQLFFRPAGFYRRLRQKAGMLPLKTIPVAYLGEDAKGQYLQHLLRKNFGGCAEIINDLLQPTRAPSINFDDYGSSIKSLISNFVNYAAALERNFDQCAAVAAGSWKLLLTCNHASPMGRCLIDAFIAAGKPVAIFPEGLGQQNGMMNRYIENVFYWPHRASGFLVSDYMLEFFRGQGLHNDFIVTGYLGNSYDICEISASLFAGWFRVRQIWRGASRKAVIFFALAPISDGNIGRFGCEETPHEVPHHLSVFLTQVDFSRYTVIVKLHGSSAGLQHLKLRYRGLDILWFVNVPWEVLANVACCTVIFHSSVGLESLAMRKPVMVWNPTGRATFASTYTERQSSVLIHVEQKEQIPDALKRLTNHDPADFAKYDYYAARKQEAAVTWLRGHLH